MYGLIGSFKAHLGERDNLIALMSAHIRDMPGCLSYIVACDPQEPETIWVTEVWDNAESHRASLDIPAVKDTIKSALPLIAEFGMSKVTTPVGGKL